MIAASYKIIETVQLSHTKIELRDDGIIQFFHQDSFQFTMREIKEIEEVVLKITNGVIHKSLIVAGEFSNLDLGSDEAFIRQWRQFGFAGRCFCYSFNGTKDLS